MGKCAALWAQSTQKSHSRRLEPKSVFEKGTSRLTNMAFHSTMAQQTDIVPNWNEENGRPVWGNKTFALARRILGKFDNISCEDREDIIQDFALKQPGMERFGGRAKFSTWFHSCLTHRALDFIKLRDQTRLAEEKRRHFEYLDETTEHTEKLDRTASEKLQLNRAHKPDLIVRYVFRGLAGVCITEQEIFEVERHLAECAFCPETYEAMREIEWFWRGSPDQVGLEVEQRLAECGVVLPAPGSEFEYRHVENVPVILSTSREDKDFYEILKNREIIEAAEAEQKLASNTEKVASNPSEKQLEITQLPLVLGHDGAASRVKGRRVCSNCGKSGHNIRRCLEPRKE